jgi:hypothetical protein
MTGRQVAGGYNDRDGLASGTPEDEAADHGYGDQGDAEQHPAIQPGRSGKPS